MEVLKMNKSTINNNLQLDISNVSKLDTLNIKEFSIQHCNEWIKNNTEKIVNLYLRSVQNQKKKPIQNLLNNLVKSERQQNVTKYMRPDSLELLKNLTQQNQKSFSDWKSDSNITSSKIQSISKKIDSIQVESIDHFLNRGGVIKKIKNRKNKAV